MWGIRSAFVHVTIKIMKPMMVIIKIVGTEVIKRDQSVSRYAVPSLGRKERGGGRT